MNSSIGSIVLVDITRTMKGDIPSLWETGGSYGMTGTSTLISNHHGQAKKPMATKRNGNIPCQHHALFALREGDHIVIVDRWESKYSVKVLAVDSVQWTVAHCHVVNYFDLDKRVWTDGLEPTRTMHAVIGSAIKKTLCKYCREPHFYREGKDAPRQEEENKRLTTMYNEGLAHYSLVRQPAHHIEKVTAWA